MTAFHVILTLALIPYLMLIGWLTMSLQNRLKITQPKGLFQAKISVLVAARNESRVIGRLIKSLANQHYLPENVSVIVSDDHSSDNTTKCALDVALRHQLKLSICQPSQRGKRAALDEALKHTSDPWLAFTDADAVVEPDWLRLMMAATDNKDVVLVLGRIGINRATTWFGKLQEAEYESIAAMTAASAMSEAPVMANGASMLVRADVYQKAVADGFQNGYTSGDDMFLLQYVKRHYGAKTIAYQPHAPGMVSIDTEESITTFCRQRLRWVSKATGYTDPAILAISGLVALANMTVVTSVILALVAPEISWIFVLFLYAIKSVADGSLLLIWTRYSKTAPRMVRWFIPLQLIYPFYSVGFGLAGLFIKPRWR